MADHRQRFERWGSKLPAHTRYLVDQVLAHIVPEFDARGFKWYSDFAAGNVHEVASHEIPLQRREGEKWPTVQIRFDKGGRPFFFIGFAMLPLVCRRWGTAEDPWAAVDVPRQKAIDAYAPAYFRLCKGKRKSNDSLFGYVWMTLFPRRKLDSEVEKAVALLPVLFNLFEEGIPEVWLTSEYGPVSQHVLLMGSWYLKEKLLVRSCENIKK